MRVLIFWRFGFGGAERMQHAVEEAPLRWRRRLSDGARDRNEDYYEGPFHLRVFQQTLQNVSNPLSIAHDSGIGDWIVADSDSTTGTGQIKKMHRPTACAGK